MAQKSGTTTAERPDTAASVQKPLSDTLTIKYPIAWLVAIVLVLYTRLAGFGYSDFDDGIFINKQAAFNERLGNIFTAFRKSVWIDFDKDIYYRPLFNVSMILNNQVSGQEIAGYHFANVLLHLGAVLLLYKLLLRLQQTPLHAFMLTVVFAVHPVLLMATAWVPGRNDTLLAIFSFAFLLQAMTYANSARVANLVYSTIFLALALFTKESAVFLIPVAWVLLAAVQRQHWKSAGMLLQYASWGIAFWVWFLARSTAAVASLQMPPGSSLAGTFFSRLPVVAQYMGKIFFPVNLSVFPNMRDTPTLPGIIAIVALAVILYLAKHKKMRMVWAGLSTFFLLLVPVLLVPDHINNQTFEHRLYLPFLGFLLVLPQTVLLRNKLSEKKQLLVAMVACAILAGANLHYQASFADSHAFWTNGVRTSPTSSYAHMMLSARTTDEQESHRLFLRAFELNPRERYVNYIYANMLQEKGKLLESEKYLLTEKEVTGYAQCDLMLARVAREKNDFPTAITHAKSFLSRLPDDTLGNITLLLLYMEADRDREAVQQANHMEAMHLEIPPIIKKQIKYQSTQS